MSVPFCANICRMLAATLSLALVGTGAHAAPNAEALFRAALPPGMAMPEFELVRRVPVPRPVPTEEALPDTPFVLLPPLRDRHVYTTTSFSGAAGMTLIAGTMDIDGEGYLAVTPPGGTEAFYFKLEQRMAGVWSDGEHEYRAVIKASLFRPRMANFIEIKDTTTGKVVWKRTIYELMRMSFMAGEPVVLAGRPYRMFYSSRPSVGLCFIYDEGKPETYDDLTSFRLPVEQARGAAPLSVKMYGGDVVKVRVVSDLSAVEFSR